MTLIITELSKFGIAMVADSAVTFTEVTPSNRQVNYVLNGARKLQPIPYLNAGISVWGRGSISTKTGTSSTDIWIGDFIERHGDLNSLDDFANILANELQECLKDDMEPLGLHLAGYVDVGGQGMPTLYHVRNVDGTFQHYEHHDFIPGQDFHPQLLPDNQFYVTRNGDYGTYAALEGAVQNATRIVQTAIGLTIPYPSLEGRIAYHSAWVKFVSDLYASSGLLKTIGGSVSSLAIYPDGRVVLFT